MWADFLKSSGNTAAHSTANLHHVIYMRIMQCHYLSVLICNHVSYTSKHLS